MPAAMGLTAGLRQLKDCRHTVCASNSVESSCGIGGTSNGAGCITCKLAERVMKEVEKGHRAAAETQRQERILRELEWARVRRDVLLTRHPTNWAGASLLQGPRPERPRKDRSRATADQVDEVGDGETRDDNPRESNPERGQRHDRGGKGNMAQEGREDSRPMLVPGVMVTLSSVGAEAIAEFGDELRGRGYENTGGGEQAAFDIIMEANREVAFAARRDDLRTPFLLTKLQATVRGWLARRLARLMILRGGCRRELDEGSGAWQYAWISPPAPAGNGCSSAVRDGGKVIFRSWYPPSLLKNESLPSPRAAARRVEGEELKRATRLAIANSFLDVQRDTLRTRNARGILLIALAEIVKLVERAMNSLRGVIFDSFDTESTSSKIAIRVLHPRGGEPWDGSRDGVRADVAVAWHRANTKARAQEGAGERASAGVKGKSTAPDSPAPGDGKQARGRSRKRRGDKGDKSAVSVPTTNENLAMFEQRVLEASLHEDASEAVASLLLRKKAVVAIREASRVGRNKDAWAKPETSLVGLAIQVFPPWLRASQRFITLVHRGRLVAVTQASPFVFWETLAAEETRNQVVQGVLRPFLHNPDLLEAMFTGRELSADGAASPLAEVTDTANSSGTNVESGTAGDGKAELDRFDESARSRPNRMGEKTYGGAGLSGQPAAGPATDGSYLAAETWTGDAGVGRESPWGYQLHLAAKGCWRVDAGMAARRDDSVERGFDSVAFEVFVDLEHQRWERWERQIVQSSANDRGRSQPMPDDCAFPTRGLVTNAMPFRLEQGLPRELGPLLFDTTADAPILSGNVCRPPRAWSGRGTTTAARESKREEADRPTEEVDEKIRGAAPEEWVRSEDPRGAGEILSHVHKYGFSGSAGVVEVRTRGKPLDVEGLLKAGLPKESSSLVIGLGLSASPPAPDTA